MLWRRENQSCGAGGGGQRSRARTRGPAGFGASLQVQPGARWQRSWASSRGCEVMPWAGESDWLLSLRSGFGAEVVLRLYGRARRADAEGACVDPPQDGRQRFLGRAKKFTTPAPPAPTLFRRARHPDCHFAEPCDLLLCTATFNLEKTQATSPKQQQEPPHSPP